MDQLETEIGTGDSILHKPTDERWLVAYCEHGYVCCCGWPESQAKVEDCILLRKATEKQRVDLLREMLNAKGSRGEYARRLLGESGFGSTGK